ncbi:MAG: ribosome-associated translation inhibitor RaiA [Duncaniella sp.]|nr:ribosome-associated translation inhibitor RaiA [Duncaniella sp.]
MDIQIKAIHFDITAKLTEFINKKVDRLVRRFPAINTVEVTLKVVKPETSFNKQAIILAVVPQCNDIVADKTADTFEEAVDLCLDAISRQLEKVKGRENK